VGSEVEDNSTTEIGKYDEATVALGQEQDDRAAEVKEDDEVAVALEEEQGD
jgi:hypothetical protein